MTKSEIVVANENVELAILGEGELAVSTEDAEQVGKEIAYRILGADTVDEVFEQASTLSARDILGKPLLIKSVRWNQSRYGEEGPKVFALITAEDLTDGGEALITCGSRNVMAQLFKVQQLSGFPMDVPLKFIENETASGYGALWLAKA